MFNKDFLKETLKKLNHKRSGTWRASFFLQELSYMVH